MEWAEYVLSVSSFHRDLEPFVTHPPLPLQGCSAKVCVHQESCSKHSVALGLLPLMKGSHTWVMVGGTVMWFCVLHALINCSHAPKNGVSRLETDTCTAVVT